MTSREFKTPVLMLIALAMYVIGDHASAQAVSERTLRDLFDLFDLSNLEYRRIEESLSCLWKFQHEDELKSFDFFGLSSTLAPDEGLIIPPSSGIAWRELGLQAPLLFGGWRTSVLGVGRIVVGPRLHIVRYGEVPKSRSGLFALSRNGAQGQGRHEVDASHLPIRF